MKILKNLLLGIVGLVASIALIGFFLPADWEVKREITIQAPAEKIYALVANLRNGWPQWSEFDFQDPDILYTFEGPEVGVGAKRTWLSKKMGNGWQEITSANPTTGVEFKLGMEQTNFIIQGFLVYEPVENGFKVTWVDQGSNGNNPFLRWMGLMMEPMMGDTFEKSLAKLKSLAEQK